MACSRPISGQQGSSLPPATTDHRFVTTRLSRLRGEVCPGQADEVYFFACWLVGVRWAKTGSDDNAAELGGHVGGGGLGLGGVPRGNGRGDWPSKTRVSPAAASR